MRKLMLSFFVCLSMVAHAAVNNNGSQTTIAKPLDIEPLSSDPIGEMILPMLFIGFLAFMLISVVRYFLDFRLKNKMIDRGMSEQLAAFLQSTNDHSKRNEVIKMAILFCGIGLGLTITYLTAPIDIHSLAIMAFSLGFSYLAYFFYLRK